MCFQRNEVAFGVNTVTNPNAWCGGKNLLQVDTTGKQGTARRLNIRHAKDNHRGILSQPLLPTAMQR